MAVKAKRKIRISFEVVCIIGLVIALSAVTFAWLPRKVRTAKEAYYENNLIISSLNLDIEFLVYDEEGKTYYSIAKYENNELVSGINYDVFTFKMEPGDKQSYRFKVTNLSETSDVISDVSIRNLFSKATVNEKLTTNPPNDIFNKLGIYVSYPEVNEISNLRTALIEGSSEGENEILFYDDLTIESGCTVDVDWYIELSTTTGNEFWGYSFGFESIYFSV